MDIQQLGQSANIIVWRDSVAAGDESIDQTVKKILATHYLLSIQGGKATWILVGNKPLAVIAQQWSKLHYLVESSAAPKI